MSTRNVSPSYKPRRRARRSPRALYLAAGAAVVLAGVAAALLLDGLTSGGPVKATRAALETIPVPSGTTTEAGLAIVPAIDPASPWVTHAEKFAVRSTRPRLAIVVIDDGSDAAASLAAMRLSSPVTLAIAPTADAAAKRADAARRFGREVLLLLPMQAEKNFDLAPNPIALHVPRDELVRRMDWNLAQIDNYVGVINHFGEATSRDAETMRIVMERLRDAGLGYIDARTHADSVAGAVARRMGIPTGDLNITVPPGADSDGLQASLDTAVKRAERWGAAIVAVPAERGLVAGLSAWLSAVDGDVEIAPVTAVVTRLRTGVR